MADPKWTPGPWKADVGSITVNNRTILLANAPGFNSGEQMVATVRLAAAAPDLYEDLVNLGNYVEWLLTYILDWDEKAAKAHVEGFTTSLRKARGETAGD